MPVSMATFQANLGWAVPQLDFLIPYVSVGESWGGVEQVFLWAGCQQCRNVDEDSLWGNYPLVSSILDLPLTLMPILLWFFCWIPNQCNDLAMWRFLHSAAKSALFCPLKIWNFWHMNLYITSQVLFGWMAGYMGLFASVTNFTTAKKFPSWVSTY